MKKTLFAALALAFVASCSNEEVVEMAQKEAISFENAFVNNSTRSVNDPSYKNDKLFSDFAVNGFVNQTVLFDDLRVYTEATAPTTTTATWKYDNVQYWIPGASYSFCALAPNTDGGWKNLTATVGTILSEGTKTITTSFDFTNNGTTDLLYDEAACVEGKASGNSAVPFTFRHLLSKVKFSFENKYNATNSAIKVTGIKITNAHETAKAELTSTTTTWTELETTPSLSLDFGDATDDEATSVNEGTAPEKGYASGSTYESKNEMLLIPSAEYEYKVEFTVALYINNELIDTYNHTGDKAATVKFAPAAGNSYDIKAVITPNNINDDPTVKQEPIEFTVTAINDWTPNNGTTVTIPENNNN